MKYEPLYQQADGNLQWSAGLSRSYTRENASVNVSGSVTVGAVPTITETGVVPMEWLYEVFVVGKNRKMYLHEVVVAKDEAGAQFRAGVDKALREGGLEPDDVTIVAHAIAQVEVEKKPQKMKIVTDEEK